MKKKYNELLKTINKLFYLKIEFKSVKNKNLFIIKHLELLIENENKGLLLIIKIAFLTSFTALLDDFFFAVPNLE